MTHIMDMHTKCGDVAKQSGKKDLFPENMTERQIKKAILEAYSKAKRIRTQSGDSNKVLVRGQADGMTIEMWVNKATKLIETAYPIKGGVSL
ncbi:EndoU domain-containing protein [Streptococcus timonensis]|uniref:EndoU domain-containing protein n=1 Tax=Streptococcus timonensis TaxID=1852387 RepID=UPI0039C3A46E